MRESALIDIGQIDEIVFKYSDASGIDANSIPSGNWVCMGLANKDFDVHIFENFVTQVLNKGLVEFMGIGQFGEKLHDCFDEVVVMEGINNNTSYDIVTLWGGEKEDDLANAIYDSITISRFDESSSSQKQVICISFDGENYSDTLIRIINKLNTGWIPDE